MELPVYELMIDEKTSEVDFVALVDLPAIKKDFLAFSEKLKFDIQPEKRIISGPLMVPDTLIIRSSPDLGDHYVKFTAATIKQIAINYAKKGYQKNVNLMHDEGLKMDGIVMFESFIVDCARGICPMKGFEDMPDGTWFGSMHVGNDDAWENVKSGKLRGFSVEGTFDYVKPTMTAEKLLQRLTELLSTPIQ